MDQNRELTDQYLVNIVLKDHLLIANKKIIYGVNVTISINKIHAKLN